VEVASPNKLGLLEEVRAELVVLEGRLTALRTLIDRAAQLESVDTEALRREVPPGEEEDDPTRAGQARSMASHMALSGYPRWSAEDQLRGTVGRRMLEHILDEVYGPKSQTG